MRSARTKRAAAGYDKRIHRLTGATDLTLVDDLGEVAALEIVGCALTDLAPLSRAARLRQLTIAASSVPKLARLAAAPALEELTIVFSTCDDLREVAALKRLRRARLIGNPWTPASYAAGRAQLRDGGLVLELSSDEDWNVTRKLWDRGLRLCFAHVDGIASYLVRPGVATTVSATCDFVPASALEAEIDLEAKKWTTEKYFATFEALKEGLDMSLVPGLQTNRTLGGADEARSWAAKSKLGTKDKRNLTTFIDGFARLSFYRIDAALVAALEELRGIKFPRWLRESQKTLAFVQPNQPVLVSFDRFEDPAIPRGDYIDEIHYTIGLLGYANDERRRLLHDRCRFYPIGEWRETDRSTLAISLSDPDDRQVYEFTEQDLLDDKLARRPARASAAVAFSSLEAMYARIAALTEGGVMWKRGQRRPTKLNSKHSKRN